MKKQNEQEKPVDKELSYVVSQFILKLPIFFFWSINQENNSNTTYM